MEYKVKIDAFEGPLDLLLHLIKKLEIDIYDIPVAEITEQYLDYIHQMQELRLDVASEYLVMAATLIEMKSRMLLPQQDSTDTDLEEEWSEEEDPRDELMRRLLEYKQYKKAADHLRHKEQDRHQVYTKTPSDLSKYTDVKNQKPPLSSNVSVYDMVSALQHMFRRKQLEQPLSTKVERQELPVSERMTEIISTLNVRSKPQPFESLFPYPNKTHIVVTFLALLELMKADKIMCDQQENFNEIMIHLSDEGA